jgi:ADP-heptose:LPS heptosyltransferase
MRILLIRFSSIGDIVLTTPVLRCIAEQKGAEVFYLTKAAFADIPAAHPLVSRVFALGSPGKAPHFPGKIHFSNSLAELVGAVKSLKLDAVVDLHNNLRSHIFRRKIGVPAYGFNKLNWEKWLLVQFGINLLPPKHIVDRYLEAAAPLGVQPDARGLDFPIPPVITEAMPELLYNEFGLSPEQCFGTFVLGATHFTKRLPADKWIELSSKISLPIIMIGGPAEHATAEAIRASNPSKLMNACGKWNLFQSAAAVQRSEWVVTHDTGLMHIAAALVKPIFSIWGNTLPEFGMYPYYPKGMNRNTSFEVKGLSCRPCSKIGFDHCPKGHFKCMNQQSMDLIAGQLPK